VKREEKKEQQQRAAVAAANNDDETQGAAAAEGVDEEEEEEEEEEERAAAYEGDAVVLFTKWPTVGQAKTRLAATAPLAAAAAAFSSSTTTNTTTTSTTSGGAATTTTTTLGVEGAHEVALAMVKDALLTMGTAPELTQATKVVLFAPSDAGPHFKAAIQSLNLDPAEFHLVPMLTPLPATAAASAASSVAANEASGAGAAAAAAEAAAQQDDEGHDHGYNHLRAVDLGQKLSAGLDAVRRLKVTVVVAEKTTSTTNDDGRACGDGGETEEGERGGGGGGGKGGVGAVSGAVAVFGMDSPELNGRVIGQALCEARRNAAAYLCPAMDGGYSLVALPPGAPSKVYSPPLPIPL
jgi:glycosyltransferase A (GT-A) superfamily protein (DUF2064 family)